MPAWLCASARARWKDSALYESRNDASNRPGKMRAIDLQRCKQTVSQRCKQTVSQRYGQTVLQRRRQFAMMQANSLAKMRANSPAKMQAICNYNARPQRCGQTTSSVDRGIALPLSTFLSPKRGAGKLARRKFRCQAKPSRRNVLPIPPVERLGKLHPYIGASKHIKISNQYASSRTRCPHQGKSPSS